MNMVLRTYNIVPSEEVVQETTLFQFYRLIYVNFWIRVWLNESKS